MRLAATTLVLDGIVDRMPVGNAIVDEAGGVDVCPPPQKLPDTVPIEILVELPWSFLPLVRRCSVSWRPHNLPIGNAFS